MGEVGTTKRSLIDWFEDRLFGILGFERVSRMEAAIEILDGQTWKTHTGATDEARKAAQEKNPAQTEE